MPNQFDSRVDAALLDEYMARGTKRDYVQKLVQHFNDAPLLCLIADAPNLYMRIHGKMHKFNVRTLVYYGAFRKVPVFHQCSCKSINCVNPYHQTGTGLNHV